MTAIRSSARSLCAIAVLPTALLVAGCGGSSFKMLQTQLPADEPTMAALKRGAQKLGCTATDPDSTGSIRIECPDGAIKPDVDAGSVELGPPFDQSEDNRLLGMCLGGLAEACASSVEQILKAGAP